ncbi:DNA translocase FtsK [Chlorobium sp. KB01]|uniref:DNA translocase FtsK n=1 Tax=Chlorobium sp. KB01 TaxID=1917528 RepID=UPI0009F93FDB|nr:DNA translocase FtsK [Chlorobium sp. KB01]
MKREKKAAKGSAPDRTMLKKEIIGIAFMLGSLYLICAILSFHPDDEASFAALRWYDIFGKAASDIAESIHNPFGLLGARLSAFFINSFLGYPVILPVLSMFFWGWSLLRAKSLKPALFFFLYSVVISIVVASMFGLTSAPFSDVMAGTIGRMLAALLSTVIGFTGAWVLLGVIAVVLTFYMGKSVFAALSRIVVTVMSAASVPAEAIRVWNEERREKRAEKRRVKEEKALRKKEEQMRSVPAPAPVMQPKEEPRPAVPLTYDEPVLPADATPAATPVASTTLQQLISQVPGEPEMIIHQTVREKEADLDERRLKVQTRDREAYRFPSIDLLEKVPEDNDHIDEHHLAESKRKLLEKLAIYKIEVKRISTTVGPRVTLFELELAPDVKVSRVKSLENDLAMALSARGIRIIAPIPGKNAVGVEIPNGKPKTVWLRSVLQVEKFKNSKMVLPIVLGKTIANEVYIADLATMPHLLIAGATGAGKSVCINVIISSLLYACSPDKVKFVMVDPKRVELFQYQHLKNHFLMRFPGIEEQIITDPQKAVYALRCVVKEMELRYETLEKAGVRNIGDLNRRFPEEALPYIVVVIDELADLMITAGREVEEPIIRIAQLARAVGIHLIVATQRPSVDVITGIIKANFPSRIAFQVASRVDSRTILDSSGADQLLGNGDMLFQPSDQPKAMRIQGPYVSSGEVEAITSFIGSQHALKNLCVLPAPDSQKGNGSQSSGSTEKDGRDSMFEEAARLVVMHQQASVSLLQRRLRLGFSRAGRVMDQLEFSGIVSEADGSRAREVLINNEDSLELLLRNLDA